MVKKKNNTLLTELLNEDERDSYDRENSEKKKNIT
jgi:hypothetical protein